MAGALADEAERHGVIIAPGRCSPRKGGLDRCVRMPGTRRVDELETAVDRLAGAWALVTARPRGARRRTGRVMVA